MKTSKNTYLLLGAALIIIGFAIGWMTVARIYGEGPLANLKGLQSDASLKSQRQPTVHFVYLNPSDIPKKNAAYFKGIESAAKSLQNWYADQLGGTFNYSVDYYRTPNPSSYYNAGEKWDYYVRTFDDGFKLTGGKFDDPNNRWIFINAAMIGPEQGAGGTNGIAVLHGDDLMGLAGATNPPNVGRYIGGLGHELGHAFTLPHPLDCAQTSTCSTDIMAAGYTVYPTNVGLGNGGRQILLNSGSVKHFFNLVVPRPNTFDLNYDNKVTLSDYSLESNCVSGVGYCSLYKNDFNKDGKIDTTDQSMIQRVAAGLPPTTNPYDLNNDGKVSLSDYTLESNCVAGKGTCSLAKNDFNKDGKIDAADLDMIAKVLSGG